MSKDDFPYLDIHSRLQFPNPELANDDGLLCQGGSLSPGVIISAYEQGLFPWFSPGDPILWWSPDPRFVLFPKNLYVSQRSARILRSGKYRFSVNRAFLEVIDQCSRVPRKGQNGTWITEEMKRAYNELHELSWAQSFEVWKGEELVGGLYGISIGSVFSGESMFSLESGASKLAFIKATQFMETQGVELIDCQMETQYLRSFGAENIDRGKYLSILRRQWMDSAEESHTIVKDAQTLLLAEHRSADSKVHWVSQDI